MFGECQRCHCEMAYANVASWLPINSDVRQLVQFTAALSAIAASDAVATVQPNFAKINPQTNAKASRLRQRCRTQATRCEPQATGIHRFDGLANPTSIRVAAGVVALNSI